jgi:hypothetical protein
VLTLVALKEVTFKLRPSRMRRKTFKSIPGRFLLVCSRTGTETGETEVYDANRSVYAMRSGIGSVNWSRDEYRGELLDISWSESIPVT